MSLTELDDRELKLIVSWFEVEDRIVEMSEEEFDTDRNLALTEESKITFELSNLVSRDDRDNAVIKWLIRWHADGVTRLCLEQELERRESNA